jgi:ribosome-associated protein
MTVKKKYTHNQLAGSILEGIQRKKGNDIVSIDLSKFNTAICQNFIICHAESGVQVRAIADSVEEIVQEELKLKPWRIQGLDNAQWVIIDYMEIIVHVFQRETRFFYALEDLWGDAKITKHKTD